MHCLPWHGAPVVTASFWTLAPAAAPCTSSARIPAACTHKRKAPSLAGVPTGRGAKSVFTISREGVQDANRDGLLGANRSNSLAIARVCNNADRPIPRLHTRVEIVNTL